MGLKALDHLYAIGEQMNWAFPSLWGTYEKILIRSNKSLVLPMMTMFWCLKVELF
jgi:hypothetical protein